jgi:PAS domain S-box-containing protein
MTKPPHILLIEDDADTQANLCDILELDGCRVEVATSAQEVRARQVWERFGIVILDRRLPDATAEELLPEIRDRAPHIDVIVMTGFADLDSTITALRHGAADYILKPINADALRASIERIRERRRIEQALHDEHQLADRMLRTAEAVVLVLDIDSRIIRFNPFLERISGWKLEEVQGKDWFEVFLPQRDHERIRSVFRRTVEGLENTGTIHSIITKDGRERQFRWSNSTLKDEQDQTVAVLSVGLDVSQILEAQNRALQAERLAAIGQTMTALAHESRNSLQRIQSGIELLEMHLEGHPSASREINTISKAVDDLQRMMEEVRAYAAPVNLNLKCCQLPQLWRRAWTNLEPSRKARAAQLIENIGLVEVELTADMMRLEQVFRNLFENSLSACKDPVLIEISCRESHALDKEAVDICIRDNGPGLSPEEREKVFDAFFTTKSSGTGLGMAIVKRIVEAHGGVIRVGDATHGGAEFVLTLPRQVDASTTGTMS